MARKKSESPKRQRGISLAPELYEAIQADADKLGIPWNAVAERVLGRAFLPADPKLHRVPDIRHAKQLSDEELVSLP